MSTEFETDDLAPLPPQNPLTNVAMLARVSVFACHDAIRTAELALVHSSWEDLYVNYHCGGWTRIISAGTSGGKKKKKKKKKNSEGEEEEEEEEKKDSDKSGSDSDEDDSSDSGSDSGDEDDDASASASASAGKEEDALAAAQKQALKPTVRIRRNPWKGLSPQEFLVDSCSRGFSVLVKVAIGSLEANVDTPAGVAKSTPLLVASERGDIAVVSFLVDRGADVNHTNLFGWSPVARAVSGNHLAVVSFLLANGATIEQNDGDMMLNPLHVAAQNGSTSMCRLLLKVGKVNVNIKDDFGSTAIFYAAKNGHRSCVEELVKCWDADVSVVNRGGMTAAQVAHFRDFSEIEKMLSSSKTNSNKTSTSTTPSAASAAAAKAA